MSLIKIQTEDFDLSKIQHYLRNQAPSKTGAICIFTGLVREFGDLNDVHTIELEHYPRMTEKQLQKLVDMAHQKWPLLASYIVHRVGKLEVDDQIVAVAVSASHRDAAFEACRFIMDYLKRDATIWKKEVGASEHWVEAKQSDLDKTND